MAEDTWVRWFDRRFPSNLGPDKAGKLLVQLSQAPVLVETLSRSTSLPLTERPDVEIWSILEHVGHLAALEELWYTRFQEFAAGVETLMAAELTNKKTWESDFNSRPVAEVFALFKQDRQKLSDFLQTQPVKYFSRTSLHPRLQQPMNPVDLMNFVVEHDKHHLMTIARRVNESN